MAKIPKAISDMSTLSRVIFDPDTIAPTVPAGVAGTAISSSRIDLSWSSSTDVGGSGLTGYLVYRNSTQIAQVGATSLSYSDTGLLASTLYQYQVAAIDGAGNLSGRSTVVSVTTQAAAVGPPTLSWSYPTAALLGIAGVQDYPSAAWPTYAKFNTLIMGGYWEGHTSLNRQAAVTGIKAASVLPIKTVVCQYMSLNEIDTSANGVAYGLWRSEVQARNWLCYLVGATGTPLASLDGGTTQEVLYTDYAGQNPSLEYPYEFGAKYCYNAVLTTTREVRFTSLSTALVATNLDAILQDNFLCDPGINGDFNRDNVTELKGSPTVITPWLQAGQRRYCDQIRALAPTKYVMANYGGGYGDAGTASAGVMQGILDGGVCESFIGKSWSRDTWQGFGPMMAAYFKALDIAKNPQMVVFQGSWPDTAADGSALPRLPTANGFPPVYTLPQYSRYIAGCAYLGGGQAAINKFSTGYSSNLADIVWPEEFDQAGAAALGWLGNPVAGSNGARPTGPRFKGMWVREFDNGAIVVSPSGNTTQTFTSTDLPGTFKTFAGTGVNDNTTFTSITMGERDARFLVRATGFVPSAGITVSGTFADGQTVTISKAAGGFGIKPGGALPLYYFPLDTNFATSTLCRNPGVTLSPDASSVIQTTIKPVNALGAAQTSAQDSAVRSPAAIIWLNPMKTSGVTGQMYCFRKTYFDHIWDWGNGATGDAYFVNVKLLRGWTSGTVGPDMIFGGDASTYVESIGTSSFYDKQPDAARVGQGINVWHTHEYLYTEGTLNTADGLRQFIVDGMCCYSNINTRFTNNNSTYNSRKTDWFLSEYSNLSDPNLTKVPGNPDPIGKDYNHCIYFDDSMFRVMISNETTYSTVSAIREICIPTAWSDTSVTVVLRKGAFTSLSGKTLWLYTGPYSPILLGTFI